MRCQLLVNIPIFFHDKNRSRIDTTIATIFLSDGDEKVESNNHWDECARL